MHRYNNQDHSMVAGVLTVRNILNKETNNIWEINVEDEYHEEKVLDDLCLKLSRINNFFCFYQLQKLQKTYILKE